MNFLRLKYFAAWPSSLLVFFLVALNLFVKGFFLSHTSLGGDEPFSVYHAQMNIASIIQLLAEGNNPPLYEIVLHFWIQGFGISEFSVRFPSLLASCVSLLFIYKIGNEFLNRRIALYASVFFIFSNYQLLFAHEARVYALLGMLTTISMYAYLHIIHLTMPGPADEVHTSNTRGWRPVVLWAITNALLMYAHYFGFFVLLAQLVFLGIQRPILLRVWKKVLIGFGITCLLYVPNIPVLIHRFMESSGGTWVQPPAGLESIYNMLWVFSNAPVVAVCVLVLFVFSSVKYLLYVKKARRNPFFELVVFWFVFVFLLMFGISYTLPMFIDRYVMPAAMAFPLVLGIAVEYAVKPTRYRYLIPGVLVLLFVATVEPNITNKREVKATVAKLRELKTDDVLVFICPDVFDLNFVYYWNRSYFRAYASKDKMYQLLKSENFYPIHSATQIDPLQLKNFDKIVYLDAAADFQYPQNGVRTRLDESYRLKDTHHFYEIFKLYEYERK